MTFSKLPALKAKQVVKAVERAGFIFVRQTGSHAIYVNSLLNARTVIPIHPGKTIKMPLLKAIIKDCNLTVEQFVELL